MAGLHGPVGKISRRLGVGITAKGARILNKRPTLPGQHGNTGRPPKISDYGMQLLEKQKLRLFYGLREKQFRNLFQEAQRMKGATGENLLSLLERRLDNAVYRQGLAVTRAQARQLVNHGHFAVNGVPTDIPSYRLRPGDRVTVTEKSRGSAYFKEFVASGGRKPVTPPDWFEQGSTDGLTWTVIAFPRREHAELEVSEQVVVEFYSR